VTPRSFMVGYHRSFTRKMEAA